MHFARLLRGGAALALLAGAASSAQAQVTLTQTHNLSASGIGSVGYSTFTVTSPGVFTIFTTGTTGVPGLYLFTGTSDALGAMLERDVAVGDYHFSEEEARSGNNDAARFGDVGITITSRDGIAVLAGQVAVVPEPGSVILLGTGLAGLGAVGVVRRRRTRAE